MKFQVCVVVFSNVCVVVFPGVYFVVVSDVYLLGVCEVVEPLCRYVNVEYWCQLYCLFLCSACSLCMI